MRLDQSTWLEVEHYLSSQPRCILIPTGSTEQHGPMGLIGTDALCAESIATQAGELGSIVVAPTLAYTPAPFNTHFPGTVSISAALFARLASEIIQQLIDQGFEYLYFLNGHGANLEPLRQCIKQFPTANIRLKSWWDFAEVNRLRQEYYGDWEGMHATPSEIAITQATHRTITSELAMTPPRKLTPQYIRDHSGDKHGPPDEHRAQFPDGRAGSHSALARPEHGRALLDAASRALIKDCEQFVETR
ncbi:MAG: creatininase family protein [Leucothrix sp.]